MLKTIIAIPCDSSEKNQQSLKGLLNSLKKFHPDLETRVFDTNGDPDFWYRATPIIAKQLFEEGYEKVIKMDCDQIILGSLSNIINDDTDYDVACVLNDPSFRIQVWDIAPYYNNGLVILKSKAFVDHWLRLCWSNHFNNYQFREQDILNILASDYMNYKIKQLDGDMIYGEWAKPFWAQAYIKETKDFQGVYFQTPEGEKKLNVWHSGGGNTPDKGNYRIRFGEDVVKYIDNLIK